MVRSTGKIWLARILIGVVFFLNVECALIFLIAPQRYASSFELSGATGIAMVRGLGILFLMWNVPYGIAMIEPARQRISLLEALAMQAIGLAGETWIWLSLPTIHTSARDAIGHFIVFDGGGLVLLALAVWLVTATIQAATIATASHSAR